MWTRIAGFGAGLVLLGGCAPRSGVFESRNQGVQTSSGAPVDLRTAYPLDLSPVECALRFKKNDEPRRVVRTFTALPDERVELLETDVDSGETLSRVVLSRTEQGDVVIHETSTPAHDLLTRFDPPMLFIPVNLAPGETIQQALRAQTFTLDDPPRAKDEGSGRLILSRGPDVLAADGRPQATLDARLVLTIGPASVESETRYTLEAPSSGAPGVPAGLIGRTAQRTVRVLGIPVRNEWESLERPGSPRSADSADTP